MARLETYSKEERNHLLSLPCPSFESTAFMAGPPLSQRKVAIISTAGLHLRDDRPFGLGAADYRLIPRQTSSKDLVMSHISTNFDRSGFQMDANLVFPLERLLELSDTGFIGSVASYHYSFMAGQALFYGKFYLVNRWYFKFKILSFLKLNESISYLTYFFITTFVRTSRKKLVPPKGSLPFFS